MEIHQLEYFLAVEKYKSFSAASLEINVSQSTLSQQIKKLEDELGVKLFVRSARSVSLSPSGKDFIVHAKRILSEIQYSKDTIQQHKQFHKGLIKIGVIPTLPYTELGNILTSFIKSYPGVDCEMYTDHTDNLVEGLRKKFVNIAFIDTPYLDNDKIDFFPLVNDEDVLLTYSSHPKADDVHSDLSTFSDETFFTIKSSLSHRNSFLNTCMELGFKPKIVEIDNVRLMENLIEEEVGVGIVGQKVANTFINANISTMDLPMFDRKRQIGLAVPKYSRLPILTKMFKDFSLKEYPPKA